jgi:putative membrane protein
MIRTLRFGTELRRFFRTRMTSAAIIVAICIPLLYGALYLWAFWNPYDKIDQLSVALVDEDRSVVASDGTTLSAGRQVTDALLTSKALRWQQTTAGEAASGVAAGTYYATVTIPAGFSASVNTAATSAPAAATIQVTYDDANGYTTRTLLASVMRELRSTVSASLGDTMVEKVLVGMNDISSGLTTAKDGATKLADGTASLASGAGSAADGAATLSSGASTLANGSSSLATGASTLDTGAKGVADGAAKLSSGVASLSTGAQQVASGAGSVASGATTVAGGLDAISAASSTVQTSASQLSTGAAQVASGNRALAQAATAASQNSAATFTALQQLVASLPDTDSRKAQLQSQLATLGGEVNALATQTVAVSAGADKVATGAAQLAQEAPKLVTSISTATAGAHQVATGAAQVSSGATTVSAGAQQAATSSAALATGASQVAAGADQVASGAGSVASGAKEVASGATKLESGTKDVADGAAKTNTGAASLRDGIASALAKVPTFGDAAGSAEVMSNPVTLASAWSHQASSMGEGYAPYFVGLALYVGALILWMLLRPISKRALAAPVSALRLVLSGGLPALALGVAQVAVLFAVLIPGLGLRPQHVLATLVFAALVSIAFVSLQQMIAIWLGPAVGRLTVLVLLMLQLTSAGGMFPASTSPVLFQVLHEVLPMSRVVNGFREAITGDLSSVFVTSVTYMVVLIAVNVAMATWGAARQRTWTITRLHPDVSL